MGDKWMVELEQDIHEFNQMDAINKLNEAIEYIYGDKKEQDFYKFFSLLKSSAFQGNALAQYISGIFYDNGIEGLKIYFEAEIEADEKYYDMIDEKKAIEWYERSAKQGYDSAKYVTGYMYYIGIGTEIDYEKARYWFLKSKTQHSYFYLGYIYDIGLGVEIDYKQAMKFYMKSAELGSSNAKLNVGKMYKYGQGVDINYEKAIEWYEKAIEDESTEAYYHMGMIYRDENLEEYEKSMEYFLKGASLESAACICQVGYMYDVGLGVEIDLEKAIEWYEKAANLGYSEAQCNLGYLYHFGKGIENDYEKARMWYLKAIESENNNPITKVNLGEMYIHGHGVEIDYVKAMELYNEALSDAIDGNDEFGMSLALYNIAEMHEKGYGVEINYEEAIKFYEKSEEYGLEDATEKLEELRK